MPGAANQLGGRIRALRTARGLTQEQFAQKLHVTRQAVSNWENSRTQPDLDTLEAMATVLGVKLAALVCGPPQPVASCARQRRQTVLCGLLAALLGVCAGCELLLRPRLYARALRYYSLLALALHDMPVHGLAALCSGALPVAAVLLFVPLRRGGSRLRRRLAAAGLVLIGAHALVLAFPYGSILARELGLPLPLYLFGSFRLWQGAMHWPVPCRMAPPAS